MLGIGAAGVIVCGLAGRRLFGAAAGLLAAALLACNTSWLTQGTTVCCEPLFAALGAPGVGVHGAATCAPGAAGVWIGLFIGLAYMTKANGLFLLPVALGAFAWRERRRLWRSREAWAALLALVVVISPDARPQRPAFRLAPIALVQLEQRLHLGRTIPTRCSRPESKRRRRRRAGSGARTRSGRWPIGRQRGCSSRESTRWSPSGRRIR